MRLPLPTRLGRASRVWSVLGVVLALALGALVLARHGGGDAPAAAPDRTPAAPVATPDRTPAPAARADDPELIGDRTGDVLVLPSLGVRSPLVSVAMDQTNTLTPPRNPREVGYWDASAAPGSTQGQTLVTGHTVHTGGGALDRLGTMRPGARVVIRRPSVTDERFTYRVTSVRVLTKEQMAGQAQRLFGQDHGDGRLRLVTCTGWDGRDYSGNVVVTATPTGPVGASA